MPPQDATPHARAGERRRVQATIPAGDVRPGDWIVLDDGTRVPVHALDNSNPVIVTFNWGRDTLIRARRTPVTVLRWAEAQRADTVTGVLDNAGAHRTPTAVRGSLGEVGMRLISADREMKLRIGGVLLRFCAVAFLTGAFVGGLLAWWLL